MLFEILVLQVFVICICCMLQIAEIMPSPEISFQYRTGLGLNILLLTSIFYVASRINDIRTLRFVLFVIFFEIIGPLIYLNHIVYIHAHDAYDYIMFFIFMLFAPILCFFSIFISTLVYFIND